MLRSMQFSSGDEKCFVRWRNKCLAPINLVADAHTTIRIDKAKAGETLGKPFD